MKEKEVNNYENIKGKLNYVHKPETQKIKSCKTLAIVYRSLHFPLL
jgi:hypothetical protein